jgi:tetratricopeptide (TPR) repeat protein
MILEAKVEYARELCVQAKWPEVLAFAQNWHAEKPQEPKAWFYTGAGYYGMGQFLQAETAYRQALKIDPADIKAWNNLAGILFEKLKRPQDAIYCIEQTVKLNPENKFGWSNLAAMVGGLGLYEQAMTYADRAITLDPNMVEAYLHKGAAARALGKPEILSEVCAALAAIRPENFRRAR